MFINTPILTKIPTADPSIKKSDIWRDEMLKKLKKC